MKKLLLGVILFYSFFMNVGAEGITQYSNSAILIDQSSGEILYEKNSYEQLYPASMTKIASLLLVMEAIDQEKISINDDVTISDDAANMGGSQVFLQSGEVYKVSELLKGVAIASGNDAVVALAEKVGGTVDNFVTMMNDKCIEIGCENTNFMNSHGLDEENHYSSAYDMALLAKELLMYESILEYTSIYEEYLTKNDGSKTWLVNTNKLIRSYPGVDGLKTGYTDLAGYCLTATAEKNNLRLISVVMGNETSENRTTDTVNLLNYGFNTFKSVLIRDSENSLGRIKVSSGKLEEVDVYLKENATNLQKITDSNKTYEFDIKLSEIKAPLTKNSVIGQADIIDNEGNIIDKVDIIIKEDLEKASFLDYLSKNLEILLGGK